MNKHISHLIVTLGLVTLNLSAHAEEDINCTLINPIGYAACLVGEATALPTITIGGITFAGWTSSQNAKSKKRQEELASAQKEATEFLAIQAESSSASLNDFPKLKGLVEDMKLIAESEQHTFVQDEAIRTIALITPSESL